MPTSEEATENLQQNSDEVMTIFFSMATDSISAALAVAFCALSFQELLPFLN